MAILKKPISWILLLALFLMAALAGGPGNAFETALMSGIASLRANWPNLTIGMMVVTNIGGAPLTLGITVIASLLLLLRRAHARALVLALTVLVERPLVAVLK